MSEDEGVLLELASRSAGETAGLAARLRPLLSGGDVVLLGGDLGAGKTTFTQGLARAMGIREQVTSPTFTLVRSYPAPSGPGLLHADIYRLEHQQEVVDLALPELLDDDAIAVIEWGQAAAPVLWPEHLDIQIGFGAGDGDRTLALRPVGPGWTARRPLLLESFGSHTRTGS